MKTIEFKEQFTAAKREVKNRVHRIMITRMVLDNLINILPSHDWKIEVATWGTAIHVSPIKDDAIKPDVFDKLMTWFAKKTNCEPTKSIEKDYIEYSFKFYPTFMNRYDWTAGTTIEFKIGNTEGCDVEVVDEVRKVTKLTGYCKALAEKKCLETNSK